MVMEACPSSSETTFTLTPLLNSSVAHVCRRSWKRRSSRTLALVLFHLDSGGFARPRVWCSKNGRGTGEEVRRGLEQRGGRAVARTDPQGRLRRAQAPKGTDTARGRRGAHRRTDSPGPGHRGEDGRAGEEALRGGGPPGGHLREAQAGQSAQAGRPSGGLPGGPGLLRSSRASRQQALEHAAIGREAGGAGGGR